MTNDRKELIGFKRLGEGPDGFGVLLFWRIYSTVGTGKDIGVSSHEQEENEWFATTEQFREFLEGKDLI